MNKFLIYSFTLVALGATFATTALGSPAPKNAQVYIISPSPGEIVTSPVTVKFGLVNMGIAPAGVDKKNTGHHHLLVNVKKSPAMDKPVPSDDQHIHFGGGQTQTTLELPKGKHTVQLLLGDMKHIPHSPPVMSEKVTFIVR